jgi:hypothetical protein
MKRSEFVESLIEIIATARRAYPDELNRAVAVSKQQIMAHPEHDRWIDALVTSTIRHAIKYCTPLPNVVDEAARVARLDYIFEHTKLMETTEDRRTH